MTGARQHRSHTELEGAIAAATTDHDRALAEFALATFHDNNSRESEAIPHYEAALSLGLDGIDRAHCLAWLASSLYKTHRPSEALRRVEEARLLTDDASDRRFLDGLEHRVRRNLTP